MFFLMFKKNMFIFYLLKNHDKIEGKLIKWGGKNGKTYRKTKSVQFRQ